MTPINRRKQRGDASKQALDSLKTIVLYTVLGVLGILGVILAFWDLPIFIGAIAIGMTVNFLSDRR